MKCFLILKKAFICPMFCTYPQWSAQIIHGLKPLGLSKFVWEFLTLCNREVCLIIIFHSMLHTYSIEYIFTKIHSIPFLSRVCL